MTRLSDLAAWVDDACVTPEKIGATFGQFVAGLEFFRLIVSGSLPAIPALVPAIIECPGVPTRGASGGVVAGHNRALVRCGGGSPGLCKGAPLGVSADDA